jgi:hypothetical protein
LKNATPSTSDVIECAVDAVTMYTHVDDAPANSARVYVQLEQALASDAGIVMVWRSSDDTDDHRKLETVHRGGEPTHDSDGSMTWPDTGSTALFTNSCERNTRHMFVSLRATSEYANACIC